jgi:hypothetical protein
MLPERLFNLIMQNKKPVVTNWLVLDRSKASYTQLTFIKIIYPQNARLSRKYLKK